MRYTSCGYWPIRRNHRFWSGGFTDQTIEHAVLMRMLKSRGGLAHGRGINPAHGRGINPGTQAKLVYWFVTISSHLPST